MGGFVEDLMQIHTSFYSLGAYGNIINGLRRKSQTFYHHLLTMFATRPSPRI